MVKNTLKILVAWAIILPITFGIIIALSSNTVPFYAKLLIIVLTVFIFQIPYKLPDTKTLDIISDKVRFSFNIKGKAYRELKQLSNKYSQGLSTESDLPDWQIALDRARCSMKNESLIDQDYIKAMEDIFCYYLRRHNFEPTDYFKDYRNIDPSFDYINGRTVFHDNEGQVTFIVMNADDIGYLNSSSKYINKQEYFTSLYDEFIANPLFKMFSKYSIVKFLNVKHRAISYPVKFEENSDIPYVVQTV